MIARRKAFTLPGEFENIAARARRGDLGQRTAIEEWEGALAAYIGAPQAAVVNSGRRALVLTLKFLGIGQDDELIIPAYTFAELLPPIQQLGVRLVPADIDESTLGVTPESVEARITNRTKAIMGLHTFGVPFDIDGVLEVGRRYQLPVIEDCAHSLGATNRGRQTGSFGYASIFSFEAIKPVNTYGGGAVVSADARLMQTVREATCADAPNLKQLPKKVRSVRLEQFLFASGLAFPFLYLLATPSLKRMGRWFYDRAQHSVASRAGYSPLQAEIGLQKLKSLDDRIRQRRERSDLLRSLLRPEFRVQQVREECQASYYFFVVRIPTTAARFRRKLLMRGIDAGIEEELTDNCARILGYNDCPRMNALYPHLMNLPLYDGVSEQVIRKVAAAVNDCL